MMAVESQSIELDERITRIVKRLLLAEHADYWMDAEGAAKYLRMSKYHFQRLCRTGIGPKGYGEARLKRWRRSALDAWQEQ